MISQFVSTLGRIASFGAQKQFLLNAPVAFNRFVWPSNKTPNRTYVTPSADTSFMTTEKEHRPSCKQFTTIGKIFNVVTPKIYGSENKVSVIGLDDVGIATAFTLLSRGVTNNICMVEMNDEILQGELLDLESSAMFLNNPNIIASKDPAATRDSRVCIVTTGTFKGRDEHEPQYVARNAGIIRAIIPPLAKYSPETVFIIASDPVDVLCYVTWRLSGVPKHRVIGTGTMLDTARFRNLLSDKFGVSPKCCDAVIIGEHGVNSVPVWSNVNIAGVRLRDVNPQVGLDRDPEMWDDLYYDAVKTDERVRQLKGNLAWSMALGLSELCNSIFTNAKIVMPVSTFAKGEHSIRNEIFMSLPCVIGQTGVSDIVRQSLTENEINRLRRGADHISLLQESANKILS